MTVEKYSVEYCSNNNWEIDSEGSYIDSNYHMDMNSEDLYFNTEKEAIKWVKTKWKKLDLFYISIQKVHITERLGREDIEIDESYNPISLEDLTE